MGLRTQIEERIAKLENFIQEQKSWKTKYQELAENYKTLETARDNFRDLAEQKELELNRAKMELAAFQKLREALCDLLAAVPSAGGIIGTVNIKHTLTTYNIIHNGEKIIDISTKTQEGRLLYCAIVDLKREPFTTNEIVPKLIERGWNMPAAVYLSRLAKDGKLVKTANGYRLPEKAKFLIDGKEAP